MELFKLKDPLLTGKRIAKDISGYIDINGCYICDSKPPKDHGRYYDIVRIIDGKKKNMKLHRYVYETYNECNIPDGMIVRHKCDNDLCINPEHLELGTHKDNMEDRDQRKRTAIGEKNGNCKLSDLQVNEIKEIINTTKISQQKIAKMYGVSQMTISNIKNNQRKSLTNER